METILSYFKVTSPWEITWAHGVNDQEKLNQCCSSADVMIIEGDIIFEASSRKAVMAHRPDDDSDLDFNLWIEKIIDSEKGAKLDFKDPKAVIPCLKKLQQLKPKVPIFLNANILEGPGGLQPKFNAANFIEQCQEYYPAGIPSVDWTSKFIIDGKYTKEMIDKMVRLTKNIKTHITFPVRACFLKKSFSELNRLLQCPNRSLTIWNNEAVPDDLREWMKNNLDHSTTFCDLVDDF